MGFGRYQQDKDFYSMQTFSKQVLYDPRAEPHYVRIEHRVPSSVALSHVTYYCNRHINDSIQGCVIEGHVVARGTVKCFYCKVGNQRLLIHLLFTGEE